MPLLLVHQPLGLHAISGIVTQSSIAEVVEHGLHAHPMLNGDIVLYDRCQDVTVGNVRVAVQQRCARTAQRPVMFVVPVVELDTIDVAATEESHFLIDDISSL